MLCWVVLCIGVHVGRKYGLDCGVWCHNLFTSSMHVQVSKQADSKQKAIGKRTRSNSREERRHENRGVLVFMSDGPEHE